MFRCRGRFAQTPLVATVLFPLSIQFIRAQSLVLAASRNAVISGVLTGLVVVAIVTGTVGIGTAAAYLLHKTSGRKGVAIAVLVVMIACAVVIASTMTSTLYITINAWMGRE